VTPSTDAPPSAVVAVLTYRRPDDLAALLPELVAQAVRAEADGRRAGVLVVDNDPGAGARALVEGVAAGAPVQVRYAHEPTPGIAAARNRALDEAGADLLVFIDDDERPVAGWLDHLLRQQAATGAAAVVGPVVSRFAVEPDAWVAAGDFFARRRPATGTRVDVAATNNLLLDVAVVDRLGLRFDERFGLSGGSDTLFTRQLTASGAAMLWCDEALVVDEVPAARVTRGWVLRRALRSGNSWSRTSLALAGSPAQRFVVRVRLLPVALVRLLGGGARAAAGAVLRSRTHQAKGARTAARGLGVLTGAFGSAYVEYRRPTVS